MGVTDEDQLSTLERRCRLLMRAYPVAYRGERGEEILGTLLEATPDGRAWPLPRDIRGLMIGSLRARATLNRRVTTSASLRTGALVGVAAYLCFAAGGNLGAFLSAVEWSNQPVFSQFGWLSLIVPPLVAATVLLAWISGRALGLAAGLAAAGAVALAGPWRSNSFGSAVTELAALAALIVLAGARRQNRRWLWPIALIVLAELLSNIYPQPLILISPLLLLLVVSIAWLAIDATPAIAVVVFLLVTSLPGTMNSFTMGGGIAASWPVLGICVVMAALALWRLRRQSANTLPPTRT